MVLSCPLSKPLQTLTEPWHISHLILFTWNQLCIFLSSQGDSTKWVPQQHTRGLTVRVFILNHSVQDVLFSIRLPQFCYALFPRQTVKKILFMSTWFHERNRNFKTRVLPKPFWQCTSCCVSAVECYLTYHGSVKLGFLCENTSNMSFTKCVD